MSADHNTFEWLESSQLVIDDLINLDDSDAQDDSGELLSSIDHQILHERNAAEPDPDDPEVSTKIYNLSKLYV